MGFSPVEQAILIDLLIFSDDKADNIANRTGYHRNSISRSAKNLLETDHIVNKGGGVYRLTEKGRNAATGLVLGGRLPYSDGSDGDKS